MRRYDDPVEVRRGWVAEPEGGPGGQGLEAPAQFLWRGRLWQVRRVLAHWRETGPWWQSAGIRAVLGDEEHASHDDLFAEREVWRVEAGRGMAGQVAGVFELALDWADGRWQLVGCLD